MRGISAAFTAISTPVWRLLGRILARCFGSAVPLMAYLGLAIAQSYWDGGS